MSYPSGPRNSITDVKGVSVAHLTRRLAAEGGKREVKTGLTAICTCPPDGRFARPAAWTTAGGRTEATGLNFIDDFGFLTNPILATSMRALGRVYDAVLTRGTRRVVLGWPPVVVGLDDSRLSEQRGLTFTDGEIAQALDDASDGKVIEGAVGAGAGLVAFGLKSGVGSASRRIVAEGTDYVVGAIALLNLGRREDLAMPLASNGPGAPPPLRGSALVVVATDLPLDDRQCRRIGASSLQGLARVGTLPGAREGVVVCVVSTGVQIVRNDRSTMEIEAARASEVALGSVIGAAIDAVGEASTRSLMEVSARDGTKDYPAMSTIRRPR